MHSVSRDGISYSLVGVHLVPGSTGYGFVLRGVDDRPLTRASFGRPKVILSVPSLDTPVCDEEAKTFIRRATEIPHCEVIVVSMDLPWAMARWLEYNPTDMLTLGSDHVAGHFGLTYGVLIPDLRLLTRAAFVVDKDGIVTFAAYQRELNEQVDFDAIVTAAKEASR